MSEAPLPEVVFVGRNITIQADPEEALLSCIRRAGLSIESTCNGLGTCGTCRVTASGGGLAPPDDKEREHLANQPEGVRLACLARVIGKAYVTLDDRWTRLQTLESGEMPAVSADGLVKRIALPSLQPSSVRPYIEGVSVRVVDPRVLNKIATWDWKNGPPFGVLFENELLDIVPEDWPIFGAAIDVGTTSLSLSLYDLECGELLNTVSALNPQTAYGGDVITRISYCRQDENGLDTLRTAVVAELVKMLDQLLGPDRRREQVYLMTMAGNTTMLHILAGVSPVSLALAPFRPTFLHPLVLTGDGSRLPIHPLGKVISLPGSSAYIGADIVGGLAAIDYRSRKTPTLFIDIGTNGEIVLILGPDRMIAASCAMGPALEGMNISCGSRAVPGAIDSFSLGPDLAPTFTTIGSEPPAGICGSGLIDLIASLLTAGLIKAGGAWDRNADERLVGRLQGDRYYITDSVFLSQHDVRQVQLAKGAVAAGILVVLEEAGLAVQDVQEIIVAGAFGYHLEPGSLKRIGLVPREYRGAVTFAGNSSLTGASFALLNRQSMTDIEKVSEMIHVVELSSHSAFPDRFITNLKFA